MVYSYGRAAYEAFDDAAVVASEKATAAWVAAGFAEVEMGLWLDAGVYSPTDAAMFRDADLTPHEASLTLPGKYAGPIAQGILQGAFSVKDALQWLRIDPAMGGKVPTSAEVMAATEHLRKAKSGG